MHTTRFSLKFRFVLIICVISVAAVILIFSNNKLYRSLVFKNEEYALHEKIKLKADDIVEDINDKSKQLSAVFLQNTVIREHLLKGESEQIKALLNNQFYQFFTASGQVKLSKLLVYDRQLNVFSVSSEGIPLTSPDSKLCDNIIIHAKLRKNQNQYKVESGLCKYNGFALHATLVPIGGINLVGYLLVVTDLSHALQSMENALRLPLQFRQINDEIVYQSKFWPSIKEIHNHIHTEFYLSETGIGIVLTISVMRNMTDLLSRLNNTTYLSLLWLAIIVLPALILTIHLAKRAFSPLKQLKSAAESLGKGVYSPIATTRYPEIDVAIDSFNDMAKRISGLIYRLENEINQRQRFQDELHTHRRKLELARDQAMIANKTKSDFLANMSHEIRTPLTAIIGFAESSLEPDQTMEERLDAINIIIKSGKHLVQIINDILDLSKIEADKLEVERHTFSLLTFIGEIESLMKLQASEKNLEFRMIHEFPLPVEVYCDALRMKQVVLNLCSNAIKFTDSGYVHIYIRCEIDKNKIYFDVVDTGIGLTSEQITKIFDAFTQADASTTRKYGGTGLGLSLSKQLTQKLGGDICVTSTLGMGSRFTASFSTGDLSGVALVRNSKEMPATNSETSTQELLTELSGSILLAEDNVNNQQLFALYFKRMGAGVELKIVNNGQEAIDAAIQNTFDLVFMDMQMPIMGGLEAVTRLRAAGYKNPIVALTANAMKEDELKCMDAGCDGFVTKPVNRSRLFEITAKYLAHAAADTAPIYSSLDQDDVELFDIAEQYVQELPATLEKIQYLHQHQQFAELKSVMHQLKGSGSAFGFDNISELAAKIEFQIINKNPPYLTSLIAKLDNVCRRVRAPKHSDAVIRYRKST